MGQRRSVEVLKDGVLEVWKFKTCRGANVNLSVQIGKKNNTIKYAIW